MAEITAEDIRNIKYFWLERGDLTRWVDWKAKSQAFWEEYPEFMSAYYNYLAAERNLTAMVEELQGPE
jgi:hypothetical protein